MNIIEAAKLVTQGKTVQHHRLRLVPSFGDFIDITHPGTRVEQSVLTTDDILSEKWTVVDE